MAAITRRQYKGAASATTITAGINALDTSCLLAATTGWPATASVPFYVVIDPGNSSEEKCSATISGSTLTLVRAQDDTSAATHATGATIYPVFTANEADEANELASKLTTKGDILVTSGSVLNRLAVGTNTYVLTADSTQTNGVEWAVTGDVIAASANTFTTNQIISGSSASAMLRITQTGAGDAFVVEDSSNPDATPFVIDASGRVSVGHTSLVNVAGTIPIFQVHSTASAAFLNRYSANNSGADVRLGKSRSTSAGSFATINTSDQLGIISSYADDGTSFVLAGSLSWSAEGTVSTGVVPSRFTINTASSSGANTERMRINSAGEVGIGASSSTGVTLFVAKNITGTTTAFGIAHNGTVQSDVTSTAYGFSSRLNTSATAFTLSNLIAFQATAGTTGATSTITNAYGFNVPSTFTQGSTTNIGFQGSLAANSAINFNFYASGTAPNYMTGRLGVGAVLTTGAMAQITNTTAADKAFVVKGAASQSGNLFEIQNSAATALVVVDSSGYVGIGTSSPYQPASYGALTVDGTVGSIYSGRVNGTEHFRIQSTSSSTTINLIANLPLLFNTNNTERMRIDSDGQIGFGTATAPGFGIFAAKNITGAVTSYGMVIQGAIQSDVTSNSNTFTSAVNTSAAAFTLGTLTHFAANGVTTPGAGSTITNQIGFKVSSAMTGATNNYGFSGNLASGTGRYNLSMSGTAANYMAGRLGVGATLNSGAMAQVTNTTAGDKALVVKGAASQSGNFFEIQNSAATALVVVDSAGNVAIGSVAVASQGLRVSKSITGAVSSFSVLSIGQILSDVTTEAVMFSSRPSTQAVAFTVPSIYHFQALSAIIGAGSAVTNQYGFYVHSNFTSATGNFGFFGNIPSGTGRWNLYMAGTAANHLGGNLCVGTTAIATSADKAIHMGDGTAPSANIASGGILYVESGALKYRGSSGTITTLGAA